MNGGRPGVLPWLYYAYGGTLPKHAQWVLHDLTCRTWVLRHFARSVVQSLPSLLLLLFPGDFSVVIYMPALVMIGGVFLAMCYSSETRDHRLYKHGFFPDWVLHRNEP
jgi:hypothetical protein